MFANHVAPRANMRPHHEARPGRTGRFSVTLRTVIQRTLCNRRKIELGRRLVKRAYLSFKLENRRQVDEVCLMSWATTVNLESYDWPAREPFNGKTAAYTRMQIRKKLSRSNLAICFLDRNTFASEWVNWELSTCIQRGMPVILMGLPSSPSLVRMPPCVRDRTMFLWDPGLLQQLLETAGTPDDLSLIFEKSRNFNVRRRFAAA